MKLQLIRDLKEAGKLHKRLMFRIRLLGVISLILLGVSAYQIFMNGYNPFIALVLALIAFPLGLYVFAGMNKVVWDEEKEIVTAGRMDIIGFATLLLYIGFDIGLRTLLNVEIGNTLATTSYLLAAIGASLLGRSFGSLLAIQKLVHKEGIHT